MGDTVSADERSCMAFIEQMYKRMEETCRIRDKVNKDYERLVTGTLAEEVLLHGVSSPDERLLQVDALVNTQRRLVRGSTLTSVVLTGNVLTLAMLTSQLAMHRWKVLEAQTSFEASEALRQDVLVSEKRALEATWSPIAPQGHAKAREKGPAETAATGKVVASTPSHNEGGEMCKTMTEDDQREDTKTDKVPATADNKAMPYLVIVDAFTHEVLTDIVCQLRSVEKQFKIVVVIVLMMHTGYQSRLPGMVVFPEHAHSLKEAYDTGCDLVLYRCFDHKVVAFFTEMFTSAVGRWQADMGQRLSIGNYAIMKNALGATLERYPQVEQLHGTEVSDGRLHSIRYSSPSSRRRSEATATLRSPLRDFRVTVGGSDGGPWPCFPQRHGLPKDLVGGVMKPAPRTKRVDKAGSVLRSKGASSSFGDTVQGSSTVWDDDDGCCDLMVDETEELECATITAYQEEISRLLFQREEYERVPANLTDENERLQAMQELHESQSDSTSGTSSEEVDDSGSHRFLEKEQQIHMLKHRLMDVTRDYRLSNNVISEKPQLKKKLTRRLHGGKQGTMSKLRSKKHCRVMYGASYRRLNHVQLLEAALMSYHDVPPDEYDPWKTSLLDGTGSELGRQYDVLSDTKVDDLQNEITTLETLLQEVRESDEPLTDEKYGIMLKSTSKVSWGIEQLSERCSRLEKELRRARECAMERSFLASKLNDKTSNFAASVGGASTNICIDGKRAFSRKTSFAFTVDGLSEGRVPEPPQGNRVRSAVLKPPEARKELKETTTVGDQPSLAEVVEVNKDNQQTAPIRRKNSIRFQETACKAQSAHQSVFSRQGSFRIAGRRQSTLSDVSAFHFRGGSQSMNGSLVNFGDGQHSQQLDNGALVIDGISAFDLASSVRGASSSSLPRSIVSDRSRRCSVTGPSAMRRWESCTSPDFRSRCVHSPGTLQFESSQIGKTQQARTRHVGRAQTPRQQLHWESHAPNEKEASQVTRHEVLYTQGEETPRLGVPDLEQHEVQPHQCVRELQGNQDEPCLRRNQHIPVSGPLAAKSGGEGDSIVTNANQTEERHCDVPYLDHHEALANFLTILCGCNSVLQLVMGPEVAALNSQLTHSEMELRESVQRTKVIEDKSRFLMSLDTELLLRLSERLSSLMGALVDNKAGKTAVSRQGLYDTSSDTNRRFYKPSDDDSPSTDMRKTEATTSKFPRFWGYSRYDRADLPPIQNSYRLNEKLSETHTTYGRGQGPSRRGGVGQRLGNAVLTPSGANFLSLSGSTRPRLPLPAPNLACVDKTGATSSTPQPSCGLSLATSVNQGCNDAKRPTTLQPLKNEQMKEYPQMSGFHTSGKRCCRERDGAIGGDFVPRSTAASASLASMYRNFTGLNRQYERLGRELFSINCGDIPERWHGGCGGSPQFSVPDPPNVSPHRVPPFTGGMFTLPVASGNLLTVDRSPRGTNGLPGMNRRWNYEEFYTKARLALMRYSLLRDHCNVGPSPRGHYMPERGFTWRYQQRGMAPYRYRGGWGTGDTPRVLTFRSYEGTEGGLMVVGKRHVVAGTPPRSPRGVVPQPPHDEVCRGGCNRLGGGEHHRNGCGR